MPKVYGTHHTWLDYLSKVPFDVRTFFGIDVGPLQIMFDFPPHINFLGSSEIPTYMKCTAYSAWHLLQIHVL